MRSHARRVLELCLHIVLPLLVVPLAGTRHAHATDPAAAGGRRGVILRIDDDGRAIVDLGSKDGVRESSRVRVNKRYVLVHPVTQVKIEDELPLGVGRVLKVSERIASVELGKSVRAVVGDIVVADEVDAGGGPALRANAPGFIAGGTVGASREGPMLGCRPCQRDPEALAVHGAWVAALPLDAAGRKTSWLRFLEANPKTRYRAFVMRELLFMASLVDAPPAARDWENAGTYADGSLERVFEGEALSPAVILPTRARQHLRAVNLFHRRPGAPLFARLEMQADGDGYYRATLPAAAVKTPGVEYFVETLDAAGRTGRVFASAAAPWKVEVEPARVSIDQKKNRSQLSFAYTFVDYYLSGAASHDFYWKLDGGFTYHVDYKALQYFKLGFGFFEGYGGDVVRVQSAVSRGSDARLDSLAFAFVYLEPELVFHELFAFLPRITVGQIDRQKLLGNDAGRRTQQIFGVHGFMRIGRRDGTNLLLGGGSTQDAGFETQLTLNLGLWKRTPVAFSAIVSNVPVNKDVGLILRGEIAQKIGESLEIGAHLGFAARNINHTGVGVGTHVTFKW